MPFCPSCGSELPRNARFCGRCGHVQSTNTTINGATDLGNSQPAPMPSLDDFTTMSTQSLPGNDEQEKANIPTMPLPSEEQRKLASQHPDEKDEEQRRRAILADFPLPIAPIGSGQPAAGNVPMVQGTPQFNGVPTVQGTPSAPSGLPDASYLASSAPPAPSLIAPPPAPHLRSSATKAAHGSAAKVVIITVTTIVVLGAVGVGIAAYLLTRPQPVISVSSDYMAPLVVTTP